MRYLVLLILLSGCTSWDIREGACIGKSIRKIAVTCADSTIIAGEVAINNETVQALGKDAIQVVGAKQELE